MLTNTHFVIIAIVFLSSVLLGVIIRILYYSDLETKRYLNRLKNVFFISLIFPFLAHRELVKHRTDYIGKINKSKKMNEDKKAELRKKIISNRKIWFRLVFYSIVKFKPNLDFYIKLLNQVERETGKDFEIKVEFEFEIDVNVKSFKEKKDIIENKVLAMFAYGT